MIKFKRKPEGLAVMKHGHEVGTVRRSTPSSSVGHNSDEPWLLEYASGRIERYGSCSEAKDAALRI